jgi:hypothetical protein
VGNLLQSNESSLPFTLGVNAVGNALSGNEVAVLQTGHPGGGGDNNGMLSLQPLGTSAVLIGTLTPQTTYKLYVSGSAYATVTWSASDIRFKKNVVPLQNSLQKVLALKGVNYEWNLKDFPDRGFTAGKQIGFIAQDVEKIIPEVVNTDDKGYKAISYSTLTVVLTEAIKEQQKTIESQQSAISSLQTENENLKTQLDAQQADIKKINQKLGWDDKAKNR